MHPCLFCLTDNASSLKLDKRGKPYCFCQVCRTRTFIGSRMGLRGLKFFAPAVLALWQSAVDGTSRLVEADADVTRGIQDGWLSARAGGGEFE